MRAAEVVALHADLLERTGDRRMQGFVDHLAGHRRLTTPLTLTDDSASVNH